MSSQTPPPPDPGGDPRGKRLESWKEIAVYLGRDVRTVQRWERREGLPVRRLRHSRSGSIHAYPAELDAWREARETGPAGDRSKDTPSGRLWILAALLTAAAASVVGLALWGADSGDRSHSGGQSIRSLAVLPLENLSADPEQEYFADGMTEAIISRLSSLRGLRIISRTSVMQFKGTRRPVPEIAKALDVDAVVAGSVQRLGNRISISAQLIAGRPEEKNLWSDTFERTLDDVLMLQSEVAQAIARRVEVTLTAEERERLIAKRTVAPEVYESYLKGRFAAIQPTQSVVQDSIRHFEAALAVDPTFAPAHTGLARAYLTLGSIGLGALPPSETRPESLAAAERALQLDPDLAEAHALLAVAKLQEWRWHEADDGFKRALAVDPNSPEVHMAYALLLAARGDDKAIPLGRQGRALDPLSARVAAQLGWIFYLAHKYHDASRECRNALDLHGGDYEFALRILALALTEMASYGEAIEFLERAAATSNRSPGVLGHLARVYALAGRREEALRIVDELERRREAGYVTPAAFVFSSIGLGDREQAFVWLERAYAERSNLLWLLKVTPGLDLLRDDPRFADLLRRVGLE